MKRWIQKNKGRLILCGVLFAVNGVFLLVRANTALMTAYVDRVSGPFKRFLAYLFSFLPLSAAELLLMGFAAFCLTFLVLCIVRVLQAKGKRFFTLAGFLAAAGAIGLCLLTAMNLLWGANYYASSFKERSGIKAQGETLDELYQVTAYFATLVNEAAPTVPRNSEGLFNGDIDEILEKSAPLYDGLVERFPFLNGRRLAPRSVLLSEGMSYLNTTGVTFPFTGECCVNTHAPLCFLPATAAHEIAHQRNVASEDEANFLAILVCLESDEPAFRYSGALLGYTLLSNALYRGDPAAWMELRQSLCPQADADLRNNNAYWDRYETPLSEASDEWYDNFLKDYDQPLGTMSYGAAADLLTAYYLNAAQRVIA